MYGKKVGRNRFTFLPFYLFTFIRTGAPGSARTLGRVSITIPEF